MDYNALSDTAKKAAREWFLTDYPCDEWWDGVYDMFKELAKKLGIEVKRMQFSGFWSQGDGASWEGTWYPQKGMVDAVRREYPSDTDLHNIALQLSKLQREHMFQLKGYITFSDSRHVHPQVMRCEMERESHRNQPPNDKADTRFLELARDLAYWLYRALEDEYECLTSDEHVAEMLTINEYQFDADGRPE